MSHTSKMNLRENWKDHGNLCDQQQMEQHDGRVDEKAPVSELVPEDLKREEISVEKNASECSDKFQMSSSLSTSAHHDTADGSALRSSSRKNVQIKEPTTKGSATSTPIPSQTSQKFVESNKLEDQINLQHLVELMRIFHTADENGSDGLDIDEFRSAFGQILGKGKDDQQMAILFMKIDTNCDGTVDWDEFCTYMLLEYQEKDSMKGEKIPPFPHHLKRLPSPHKDTVSRITVLTNVVRGGKSDGGGGGGEECEGNIGKEGNIVTVSKDGLICFWKSNLTLNRTIQLDSSKPKLMWVTDMVVMPNVHKVLLSFTDRILAVHDLLTPKFERIFHITALPHCAVTLDYWYDDSDYDHSVLTFGDSGGGVCIMEFTKATRSLFGVSTSAKQDCVRIPFPELQHHYYENMKTTYLPKVHSDWVNKVRYWSCVEGVLSCSCDSVASLVITDINYRKESNLFQVWKGMITFDYSKEWNIIATGGMDRDLRLWNPYVSTKPTAVLKGHNTAIIHVTIVHLDGLILSFSKDKELRVWSIQDQLCLQTCHRFQQLDDQIPYAFYFHSPTASFIVGSNQLGALELYREENQKKCDIVSHEYPLCGALYNSNFNQVVSACHGSVVSVWDVDTGEKIIQFSNCHGNLEITAMAFDPTGRRLITGARDGSIKIWNFNNGACLSKLQTDHEVEVTCFCFLKQKILVSGWNRIISEYRDMREPDDIIPKYWGMGVHTEDILCMAHIEPDLLATASYDGSVVLWDMEIEQPIIVLNESSNCSAQQCNKLYNKLMARKRKKLEAEGTKGRRRVSGGRKGNSGIASRPISSDVKGSTSRGSEKPRFGFEDNTAVESLIFLPEREHDTETASLIVCGAGGIVQFWNIYGGGLLGEFSVFDHSIRTVASVKEEELKMLHGVTACKAHSNCKLLLTGTSLGHIQEWDISGYCVHVPSNAKPIRECPPMIKAWLGHFGSVVSIDIAEKEELIITASTDRCVCLWTLEGRYIGTFGEKQHWKISDTSNLPRKLPPGLHQVASFNTIQTVAGTSPSKWRTARNLFLILMKNKHFVNFSKARESIVPGEYAFDDSYINKILGEAYKRKTRFRQPIRPLTLRSSEKQVSVYSSLKCPDLEELVPVTPPISFSECYGMDQKNNGDCNNTGESSYKNTPKNAFTEKTLFPKIL